MLLNVKFVPFALMSVSQAMPVASAVQLELSFEASNV